MRFLLVFLLGTTVLFQTHSQTNEMVGFACGAGGSTSDIVIEFDVLLYYKNYESIKSQIFSKSAANQFLAVVAIESLVEKKLIELDNVYLNKIEKIKQSEELVKVCAGCTYWDAVSLKELFDKSKIEHKMYVSAQYWMKNYFTRMKYELKKAK